VLYLVDEILAKNYRSFGWYLSAVPRFKVSKNGHDAAIPIVLQLAKSYAVKFH
jgi:hypothetical protein